jgi:hypothetical protein
LHPTRSTISTLCPKLCCHCGGWNMGAALRPGARHLHGSRWFLGAERRTCGCKSSSANQVRFPNPLMHHMADIEHTFRENVVTNIRLCCWKRPVCSCHVTNRQGVC